MHARFYWLFKPFLFSLLAVFPACGSVGHINSLDDLTAHVDSEGYFELPQIRLLSLSGLMPSGQVGSMYRFDSDRTPFTAVGISQIVRPGEKPGEEAGERVSYQSVRSVKYKPCLESGETELGKLLELRDKLVEVQRNAGEAIVAQLARAAYAKSAHLEADATTLKNLGDMAKTQRDHFLNSWQAAIAMINTPGLLVIRTNTYREQSLIGKIQDLFGLSTSTKEESSGFAIVAGMEFSMLYLGTDLDRWVKPNGADWYLIGDQFPYILNKRAPFFGQFEHTEIEIVTSRLASEYVVYTSDKVTERQLQAKLSATIEELSSLDSLLDKSDKLEIEGILNAVESIGNAGVFGPVEEVKVAIDPSIKECEALGLCQAGSEKVQHGWRPLYEVLTDYDDLVSMKSAEGSTDISRWWNARWQFTPWF